MESNQGVSMDILDAFAFILTETWNEIISRPFVIAGHTLSFSQVFIYTTVAGLLLWMVGEVFNE